MNANIIHNVNIHNCISTRTWRIYLVLFIWTREWWRGWTTISIHSKNGQIWKHNINPLRNNFYGTQYDSVVNLSLNDMPTENKMFKHSHTLAYSPKIKYQRHSAHSFLKGNIQGLSQQKIFVIKEGEAYANIQSNASDLILQWKIRALGNCFQGYVSIQIFGKTLPIQPPAVGATNGDTLYYKKFSRCSIHCRIIIGYFYDTTTGLATFYTATQTNTPANGDVIIVSKTKTSESYGLQVNVLSGHYHYGNRSYRNIFSK